MNSSSPTSAFQRRSPRDADPTLDLRDASGTPIAFNAGRDDPAQATLITAAGLQPQDPLESAIATTLGAGPYTAIVAGKNSATGVALVEVYNLQ